MGEELKAKFLGCTAAAAYLDAGALYQGLSTPGERSRLRELAARTATV
jgi:hypothetical protein